MAEVDWSGNLSIRLVKEYKKRPELWDSTHAMYRVQTAKYEAWSDMARVFECDIADLRKKLNSIFASHRREKAKIRNGGTSTWFLYPHLRFLPSHLESNPDSNSEVIVGTSTDEMQTSQPTSDRSDQSSDDDDDDDEDNREETEILIKQEPVVETYCIAPPANSAKRRLVRQKERPVKKYKLTGRPLLKRKIVKEHDTLDNRLLETLKLLRKSDLSRKKDECDSFGEYIAISLRKHDERTQSMIKQAINNILFEQEMKKYSAGQYTVVLSEVDENPLVIGDNDDK